jgi:FixJ family two-component response regulator
LSRPAGASATVFVVEDDPASRESLCALLQSSGFACKCFATGGELLRAANPQRPGCVITDYRMPEMNGVDLQAALIEQGCHWPLIMVSGYATVPVAVQAMQLGALTVLEKPLHNSALLAAVGRALALDRDRRERHIERLEVQRRLAGLSDEELQVLRLLVAGKPNKAIATELNLGLRTVERRRQQILEKMGVGSLAELAALVGKQE